MSGCPLIIKLLLYRTTMYLLTLLSARNLYVILVGQTVVVQRPDCSPHQLQVGLTHYRGTAATGNTGE